MKIYKVRVEFYDPTTRETTVKRFKVRAENITQAIEVGRYKAYEVAPYNGGMTAYSIEK